MGLERGSGRGAYLTGRVHVVHDDHDFVAVDKPPGLGIVAERLAPRGVFLEKA